MIEDFAKDQHGSNPIDFNRFDPCESVANGIYESLIPKSRNCRASTVAGAPVIKSLAF